MAREALAGTRIRERRTMSGLKQSDLARRIGISASYLNLIEHNRRRIGGKLLLDIAAALDVEPTVLSEGAEAALLAALREAAERARLSEGEVDRTEEFAGRFPGWADALAAAHRKIADLERTVETLSDRLAHDPELAASVHEVLSTAAAIRSTASILAEDKTLSDEWRDRFHANIDTDSRRLADSSKALVGFLDTETGEAAAIGSPQEELAMFLAAHDDVFRRIERGQLQVDTVLADAEELASAQSKHLARNVFDQTLADAQVIALDTVQDALSDGLPDPVALANRFSVDVPCVMRRLAALPDQPFGLVIADRAGSLLFRKAAPGFTIPRYGAACPLWPLFQAPVQPGQVLHQRVRMPGTGTSVFDCYAMAETVGPVVANTLPLMQSTMLIVPVPEAIRVDTAALTDVGPACRICPRRGCPGRREPSILSDGFSGF